VNTTTEQVQRGIELGDRLLMVRYEDLVTDPETTLREVFEWLDEPWSDRLLEHDKVHAERGTAKKVEGATRSDKPIATDRIAAWAVDKDPEDLAVLTEKTAALARFYGYDVTDPQALSPMEVAGSPRKKTLTGEDLAVHKAQFPELAAEFDRDIVPWAGNRMLTPDAVGIIQGAGRKAKAAKKTAAKAPSKPPPTNTAALVARARRMAGRVRSRLTSR
jgi:hypothetical protein